MCVLIFSGYTTSSTSIEKEGEFNNIADSASPPSAADIAALTNVLELLNLPVGRTLEITPVCPLPPVPELLISKRSPP